MDIQRRADILYQAEDHEIRRFFRAVVFRGVYRNATQDEKIRFSWVCGFIENITLNGRLCDLCPRVQPVPKKFDAIVDAGPCEFTATVDERALRDRSRYQLLVHTVKNIKVEKVARNVEREKLFCRNLKLKDKKFIGQFNLRSDGSFVIEDIRRSDFSKLILQNGKPQSSIEYTAKTFTPQTGVYYEFSWVLRDVGDGYSYDFGVDESAGIVEITPNEVVNRLNKDIMDYPAGAAQKIVKMLDTLKTQLTASGKEIFIYELLQNANDYPIEIDAADGVERKKLPVDVEFHLTKTSLVFMHTGAPFNEKNVAAICSINDKEKDTNKDTIGYKGIGFKTVFLDNENVYLQSGGYSFRFDREASRDIVDTPWQILPVWTNFHDLTSEERAIFTKADGFNVKFALIPIRRETLYLAPRNYAQMFREIFANERVILFIPNLRSVRVYTKGTPVPDIVCARGNDKWRVDDYEESVDQALTVAINESIDEQEDSGALKIPTKYYDFTKTKISFACEVDGRKLKSVPNTCLYCYLPAKNADWGLKFLMNSDMIPNGQRDDVEVDFDKTVNVNEAISKIAGGKLFEWVRDLSSAGQYELDSVFQLVPDFRKIKAEKPRKYEALIDALRMGFETRLEEDAIVPVQDGNRLARFRDIVLDETGLSSSGIMTDGEFLTFTDLAGKQLPVRELRGASNFERILSVYLDRFGARDNVFSKRSLRTMIRHDDFKNWLKVQENNDRFLKFLLDRGYLKDFLDAEIFIEEECGNLYKAADLYYDVDEELEDLRAFSRHIRYLSLKTREFFGGNEEWQEVCADAFAKFRARDFVEKILLSNENWDETVCQLHEWDTSLHFYRFLVKTEVVPSRLKDLPFFDDSEESRVVDDFNDKFVFLPSEDGQKTCAAAWLSSVAITFSSKHYGEEIDDYFCQNAGVQRFADEILIAEVILGDKHSEAVNQEQQKELESSKGFVDYCFAHRGCFAEGSLSRYALHAADGNGEWVWVLSEDHVYFPSEAYDGYSRKSWLDKDWMYCLDEIYLPAGDPGRQDFVREAFGVAEMSSEKFYRDVVRRHAKEIIDNTSGDNDPDGEKNFDFVAYLDENYDLIFNQEKDADKFSGLVVVEDDEEGGYCDIDRDIGHVYLNDASLTEIVGSPWFPKDLVAVCSSRYGESKALVAIGIETFRIGSFFDDVVVGEFSSLRSAVDTKEKNVAFHDFVLANIADLTPKQIEVMKGSPVYLYGQDRPSATSSDHRVLSSKARELQEMGLVEFSALDIISPEYRPEDNPDYWESLLGNTKFTVVDFVNWVKDNQAAFQAKIQDPELNISFWRWLKDSNVSDETIKALPPLSVCLKDGTTKESDAVVYLADEYIQGGGIEALVRNYNPDAAFVSPAYLDKNDDVESWRKFWSGFGFRHEILGVLRDAIDNRLGEILDVKLVATISSHRTELEKTYGEELLAKLVDLKLQSRDGEFRSLHEVIYVDCEKDEPFPCVELPNQVSFATGDERRLINDVLDAVGGSKIDSLQDWRRAKILRYLQIQDDSLQIDVLRATHYKFVDELAALFNEDPSNLEFEGEKESQKFDLVRKVRFLDRENRFVLAQGLAEGSVYKPFCDFEHCGLAYAYLSDSYATSCSQDVRKMWNRVFHVHCDFREQDIHQLENREFAVYFWKDYLPKTNSRLSIKGLIEDRKFDSVACIPTKDYMKRPGEVYSPCKEMAFYVRAVEDSENKVPLKDIPEVEYETGKTFFSLLLNKTENLQLSFLDSLYALFNIVGKDKRSRLLEWMIGSYGPNYEENIRLYRADDGAKWKNTKNDDVHISQLYALAYGNKLLEQYFGTLPQIINPDYLPGGEDFAKACEILGVTVIGSHDGDVIVEPRDAHVIDVKTALKFKSLALAYCVDAEHWKEKFDAFKRLIESAVFYRCSSISVRYREDVAVCQERKMFSRGEDSSAFYFVKSLDDNRVFTKFVDSFVDYLGLAAADLDSDLVETIMASEQSAEEWLRENNDLMTNDAFKHEIELLKPGSCGRFVGKRADEDDIVDDGGRHVITVREDEPTPASEDDGEHSGIDSPSDSRPVEAGLCGKEDEGINDLETDSPVEKASDSHDGSSRAQTSDRGESSRHDPERGNSAPRHESATRSPGSETRGLMCERTARAPRPPRPFSAEDVERFRSKGKPRFLDVLEPTQSEISEINQILDGPLTAEQVADQNFLAQLRLYRNLEKHGMYPEESLTDFVKNGANRKEQSLSDGKYIHKCSAAGGILYLSPAIWNKVASGKCVVCVYLGAKANDFMYFRSIQEILAWVREDDIVIKLTGEEKARTVEALYTGVLEGVKGTAYTMLRVQSNERYDSLFAPLDLAVADSSQESEDEY